MKLDMPKMISDEAKLLFVGENISYLENHKYIEKLLKSIKKKLIRWLVTKMLHKINSI